MGPTCGFPRHTPRRLGFFHTGRDFVVMAADDNVGFEVEDTIDDFIRCGSVSHEIAKNKQSVIRVARITVEDRVEGVDISVDVAQNKETHWCRGPRSTGLAANGSGSRSARTKMPRFAFVSDVSLAPPLSQTQVTQPQ